MTEQLKIKYKKTIKTSTFSESDIELKKSYLNKFTYGLTEIYREQIKKSNYVALPGCFPTSTLLALAPALSNKLIACLYSPILK